ncbi:hypothetical protein R3P38DRAFT_2983370 [Favolaschia claudopus]|uniref:RING-type domain-containing protein n=1 Tax=Favolaschia claudopus TaxID=2862362 RepID=A0AAW0B274_9AGAR
MSPPPISHRRASVPPRPEVLPPPTAPRTRIPPRPRGAIAETPDLGARLCVICQDEEAIMAVVDCGHMAMCKRCSEVVMSTSRLCPLCRTRIADSRLIRIFTP